jgi:hypothetical protein
MLRQGILFAITATGLCAQQPQTGVAFFESTIQPILRANCLACHSDKTLSSGLSLETREAILKGGNRGPGPEHLLAAVKQSGDLKMPPGRKLKDDQIAALERWIQEGLPVPESLAKAKRRGADHWAYKAPKKVELPAVQNAAWVRNPIDRFILARLEKTGIKPSSEADRETLLRRVSLDLIGLPPTEKERADFLADQRPDAYERTVDRLLASPHYGERWGREWLDLARYADSDGYTIDAPRNIWKYRDWVINAINKDEPFDQFVIEQFAGDLLEKPSTDQLIATGFHRNTPSNFEGGIDFEQYRVEAVADRVATTGAAFMGLTLGCARCHDHKYDPISQKEFYQLFAFLNNVDEVDKEADRKLFNKPFLEIGTPEELARKTVYEAQYKALEDELAAYRKTLLPEAGKTDVGARERLSSMRKFKAGEPKLVTTMITRELPKPRQTYIHLGGDFTRYGANVSPGVPSIFPPLKNAHNPPNRLDLARWLVDRDNPLTARVTVNRMWQRYFGKGFVDTENDFGAMGEKPSHPELLDWLAVEFMDSKWSQKAIHRLIVTSATYRQSSEVRKDLAASDPDNRLLARQSRLRLDAENVRDAGLVASGLLTTAIGGPSVYPPIPAGVYQSTQVRREWKTSTGADRYRRGIYTFFQRSAPHPGLVVFDAPDSTVSCTRRVRSNTPLQALMMLNDESNLEFADALAKRIRKEVPADDAAARIRAGYQITLNRDPRPEEVQRLKRFLDSGTQESLTALARVLLNLDEFVTRP